MNNQNRPKFLNRGISTPTGILIIVIIALLAGGILAWQWMAKEVKVPEVKVSEDIVKGYVNTLMSRSRDNVLPYLTGEAKEQVQKWPASFGTSNPHLGSFEILSSKKLNDTEFEFIVREYQEYTGEGIIGYNDETLIVIKVNNEYLISSIEASEYVDIKETADWKTYTNKEYGFEIKYPDMATEGEGGGLNFQFVGARLLSFKVTKKDLIDCFYSPLGQSIKKEKVLINNQEFCLNIDLDSAPSTKMKYYNYSIKSGEENNYIILQFIAEFNPYCGVYPEYKCEKFDEDKATTLFNQMLSTFRFLE